MKNSLIAKFRSRQPAAVLGLALDGGRIDGVVLRRVNGSLQASSSFSATLSLDLLTAPPELVGREIRNHLDAAGIRERRCVIGLPLRWVLTTQTELPEGLPSADADSMLALEAEKNFHADAASLQVANSRSALEGDRILVLLAGIPNAHLDAMERVLAAAKLKPVSFAIGVCAVHPPAMGAAPALALLVGEGQVSLQVTAGGGVVALRSLEGAVEIGTGRPVLQGEALAREIRITLGQLPAALRDRVNHLRIFGPRELAQAMADELELKLDPLGIKVEMVSADAQAMPGTLLPQGTPISAASCLAAGFLSRHKPPFEFLLPKPNPLVLLAGKYTSGRIGTAGVAAAAVLGIVLLMFLVQQIQMWSLRSQWGGMAPKVRQIESVQDNVRKYRAWYGGDCRNLSVLRQLSLAFPEDGSVTARSIEIRGGTVTCSGTARDYGALLAMQSRLRAAAGVESVKLQQIRGRAPMQFVFAFTYNDGGAR